MIDEVSNKIILSVISSLIQIYDLTIDPPLPFPHFLFFLIQFFFYNKQPPLPPNLNTIQPPTKYSTTRTLSLLAFVF
jgi:hypothetical protein